MEPFAPRFTVSIGDAATGDGPAVVHKRGVDLRSAETLHHEREVLTRISHPGVVEVARDAETAGPPTLSTYLAGNLTLADRPPTDATSIARTGAQIATTLAELHEARTTHGSVAPEHCVLGPGGSVVLCSLRRATDVSGPDHPSAVRDVGELLSMLRSWRDAAPARRNRAAARLESVLATAERRTPTARDLALALSGPDHATARARRRGRGARIAPASPSGAEVRRPAPRQPKAAGPVAWRAVIALAAAVAAAAVLWQVALPDPAVPVDGFPPALVTAAAALRWVALAACAYLVALGALTLAASLSRDERLARAADRLAPGRVRRWAAGVTSLGLLGSAAAATLPADGASVTLPRVDPHPARASTTSTSTTSTTTTPAPPPEPPGAVPLVATPVGPAAPTTWTVARGDHLWSIAERSLHVRLGRPGTEDEVRRYWSALVVANRGRLADPSNPDLIFAGQVFLLPSI